jgi:flagellin-like protein
MKTEFNQAANDSPRSGSSKKISPVVGVVIVVAIIAIAAGLKMLA